MLKVTESREVTLNHNELIATMQRGDIPVGTTVRVNDVTDPTRFNNKVVCPVDPQDVVYDLYKTTFGKGNALPFVYRSGTYTAQAVIELPEPAPGVTYTRDQALLMFRHALWGGDWACTFRAVWSNGGCGSIGTINGNAFYEYDKQYTIDLVNPDTLHDPISVASITLTVRIKKRLVRLNDVELLQALRNGSIPHGTPIVLTHWNGQSTTVYAFDVAKTTTGRDDVGVKPNQRKEYKTTLSANPTYHVWGNSPYQSIDAVAYAEYRI